MDLNLLVPIIIVAALVVFVVMSAVRIVPQARRYNVERFGRYRTTLEPGLNFIIPLADRINNKLDVREQVFSSQPKPVITEDNLVVNIDTVLYYQITDPRAAAYDRPLTSSPSLRCATSSAAWIWSRRSPRERKSTLGCALCWTRRLASGESE
jgi:regulator of protease activity HflC (stomatin/prohibitin superfamily)